MITIKSDSEIALMRIANRIVSETLKLIELKIKVGITTKELDKIAYDYIIKSNATPSFLGYGGFPATICASRNEAVVHGIPDNKPLVDGDILSVDIGCIYKGYHGDAARTFAVGTISDDNRRLIDVTRESFYQAVAVIKEGARLGDVGNAVQSYAESHGYSVVRDLTGHGIGREMHEDPAVPNYGKADRGVKLKAGMTIAIEPMINQGSYEVKILSDGWTVVTKDGRPSSHHENTVLVTVDGVEILSE